MKITRNQIAAVVMLVGAFFSHAPTLLGEGPPSPTPLLYEIQINGESFTVEANRLVHLESKEKPGVAYAVAIRQSPVQRIRLNHLRFDYEEPAEVVMGGTRENPSARLNHELGYSILVNDLGPAADADAMQETLKLLIESVAATLRENKATEIETSEPYERSFAGTSARGVTVQYRDAQGMGHVCLIYVLSGRNFAASCVAEYLDNDAEDALPQIKKLLDSVAATRKS